MKKNNSFKEGIMQLCTINNEIKFISLEDWTSEEIRSPKYNYNIEFFDVVKVEEVGYNESFPSELFFKISLENGNILNVAGQWYNKNTIDISYIK